MDPADLRVALFSGNYNYIRDGANQALNQLVGHLLRRGVTMRTYSPTLPKPAFPPTGDLVDVPAIAVPFRPEYRLALGLPKRPRLDVEAYRPDIVHLSAPDILGHKAIRWAREHGVPTIASLHTRFETYPGFYGLGFLEQPAIRIQTRFYNSVDQVLVPSASMGELLRERGVTAPIGIWSRGIDHDRFNPGRRDMAWRRSLGIADGDVVVSFLGRLVLEKGLDIFAEVITELKRRGVPHRVLVVGEGPARDWFIKHVPDAVFTGFLGGDALGKAVASMDVFFMPSTTETFGNVTTETMAAGVPVVGARATGTVDLVQDGVTGFLVPPTDVRAYADAIQRLIEDGALRASASKASQEAARPYVWDKVNEAVLDAYLALMARKRGC